MDKRRTLEREYRDCIKAEETGLGSQGISDATSDNACHDHHIPFLNCYYNVHVKITLIPIFLSK